MPKRIKTKISKNRAVDLVVEQLKKDVRVVLVRDLHGALKEAYCAGAADACAGDISSLTFKANVDCKRLIKRFRLL